MSDVRSGFASGGLAHRVLDHRLTLVLRIVFYAVASLSLATLIATLNEISAFDRLRDTGAASAVAAVAEAEKLSEGFANLVLWVGLTTGILTIVWWYRAYVAISRTGMSGLKWSPGWAIGGWLIPLGNFVVAKLVLDEIDRVSAAAEAGQDDWRQRPRSAITGWWWGFWMGGLAAGLYGTWLVSAQLDAPDFDAASYRDGLIALVGAHGLSVIAAFLAAASFRVLGERLHASH